MLGIHYVWTYYINSIHYANTSISYAVSEVDASYPYNPHLLHHDYYDGKIGRGSWQWAVAESAIFERGRKEASINDFFIY